MKLSSFMVAAGLFSFTPLSSAQEPPSDGPWPVDEPRSVESSTENMASKDEELSADADLAQKLNNPLASLISVPIQNNFDFGGGPDDDGFRYSMVAQPVLPFNLNEDWNLITRTIIPFAYVDDVFPGSESGVGDIVSSFWFSPAKPSESGLIWGVGPAVYLPTASNDLLGADQWGAGPSAVAVWVNGPWTRLILANHIRGISPPDDRERIDQSFLQMALAYTTPARTTYFVSTESSYDHNRNQETVPLQAGVNQLLRVGGMPLQLGGLVRYYARSPDFGPDWGFQVRLTFVFPRRSR